MAKLLPCCHDNSDIANILCTDVRYCLQVVNNTQSALIRLYCREVGQIGTTVGSHLKWFDCAVCLLGFTA